MNARLPNPIILVANNPFGHHLLTSQLLSVYQRLDLEQDLILLCNGVTDAAVPDPSLRVKSFAKTRFGIINHLILLFTLVWYRLKYPKAVYHLRGFVTGFLFLLSRVFRLRYSRYIYDPRGAFFIEWREAGGAVWAGRLFSVVEARLIRHCVATIVTTQRFSNLYRRLFGHAEKYQVIYNSTSFPYCDTSVRVSQEERVKLVYMGTFNYWHDLDELYRVMACASDHFGAARLEVAIFTPKKFHQKVLNKFSKLQCAALEVEYVEYNQIPKALAGQHIGVSVVRPTLSTRIASPIKIADYVAHGLVPLLNTGIGDFDKHFATSKSAILYSFGQLIEFPDLHRVQTQANDVIYGAVSREEAKKRLMPLVGKLVDV